MNTKISPEIDVASFQMTHKIWWLERAYWGSNQQTSETNSHMNTGQMARLN